MHKCERRNEEEDEEGARTMTKIYETWVDISGCYYIQVEAENEVEAKELALELARDNVKNCIDIQFDVDYLTELDDDEDGE